MNFSVHGMLSAALQLTEVIQRILSFPLQSSLMKILQGLELLLQKSQVRHTYRSRLQQSTCLLKAAGGVLVGSSCSFLEFSLVCILREIWPYPSKSLPTLAYPIQGMCSVHTVATIESHQSWEMLCTHSVFLGFH